MAQKMRRKETALGLGLGLPGNPFIARLAQQEGLDWAFIDLEHSLISASEVAMMANYLGAIGLTPLVRLDKSAVPEASRYLDSGVQGIVMPHVDTAAEAAELVSYCKYPPIGRRSWGGVSPQLGFPLKPAPELIGEGTTGTLAIAMIESAEGFDNLNAIAGTEGIDGLLVGAVDLSIELGVPGQIEAGAMQSALARVERAARDAGVFFGLAGIAQSSMLDGLRPDFVLMGMDHRMLAAEIATRSAQWTRLLKADPGPRVDDREP